MLLRGELNDGTELTYAFGLIIDRYKGLPVNRHGGSMNVYRTHVLRLPEQPRSAWATSAKCSQEHWSIQAIRRPRRWNLRERSSSLQPV
jgi:hypothetical protein